MCTKYTLKDDPSIFKQFIPRNLSNTSVTDDQIPKFNFILTPCLKHYEENDSKRGSNESLSRISRKNGFQRAKQTDTPQKTFYLYIPDKIEPGNCDRSPECSYRSRSANTERRCRKSVRFADDLGLNLSRVRIIKSKDAQKAPNISAAATKYLDLDHNTHLAMQGIKYFTTVKTIERDSQCFADRIHRDNICIEEANINLNTLYGRIAVKNLSFEKYVGIRISYDSWKSYKDIFGSYILDSSNGDVDKFSFSLSLPQNIIVGTCFEFCGFYWTENNNMYWDNNCNENYTFECYAKVMGIVNENGWMHFL